MFTGQSVTSIKRRSLVFLTSRVFLLLVLTLSGCTKHFSSTSVGNLPPKTFVAEFPYRDSTQSPNFYPQPSRLEIHWWANDPDGLVIGYVITFDTLPQKIWTFTVKNDSVFSLPLFSKDTSYVFSVAAIDNSFKKKLNEGDTVSFASLGNSVDPKPPSIRFPIVNTPPVVQFVMNGGEFSTRSDIPETTFTVASFGWAGTDLDGNTTITNYYIALNDTSSPSSWLSLPSQASFVTLIARTSEAKTDTSTVSCDVYANTYPAMSSSPLAATLPNMKLNGNNILFLKAEDVAGAFSSIARMPDTTHNWFVKKPRGDVLVVNDYASPDPSSAFYRAIFDSIGGHSLMGKYDVWDIRAGTDFPDGHATKGNLVQPCIVPSFQETLKLYKYVYWYSSDHNDFDIAQIAVRGFRNAGGKIFFDYFAITDTNAIDAASVELRDFTGAMDSISSDILRGTASNSRPITSTGALWPATSVFSIDSTQYPNLVSDNSFLVGGLHGIYPAFGANVVYRMQPYGTYAADDAPIVGVMSGDGSAFVVGVPLYHFDGGATVSQLIYTVFKSFGAIQ